ncbi:chalcone isomerase family protein [Plasticicumulans acidivorans]|uniref:Chalcone isomerase-like protein n=1 Tax=Plasticicumulans acidivorans TaxID=886464 RepID=A0A317MXH8_9GAMM|nr:chalcone isomerase family protein [Plasticicumulans acidivorans]PWV63224.1 chalcone isomerase-like protein [Plasticicumulans acidivorans]
MRPCRLRSLLLGALLAVALPSALPAELAGVTLAPTVSLDGRTLILNGAGIRTRFLFKVYVAGLYLSQPSDEAVRVLDSREPRRIELRMLRELDADTLFAALESGLRANLTAAELAGFAPRIAELDEIFRRVGKAASGDRITLDVDARGVTISVNEQRQGRLDDAAFARALLSIWLGAHPVDSALKRALLGGKGE